MELLAESDELCRKSYEVCCTVGITSRVFSVLFFSDELFLLKILTDFELKPLPIIISC